MSGFEISKGRGHAYAPEPKRAERTDLSPAEKAKDAYLRAERTVVDVEATVEALRKAQAANDFGGWQAAQDKLNKEVDRASREIESALASQQPSVAGNDAGGKAAAGKAPPIAGPAVDTLLDRLAVVTGQMPALNVAPKGFAPVSSEQELLAAIQRKPSGPRRPSRVRRQGEGGQAAPAATRAEGRAKPALPARQTAAQR